MEAHELEKNKYAALVCAQDSEARRLCAMLEEHAEFRDGIYRDRKDMDLWMQQAKMLQEAGA